MDASTNLIIAFILVFVTCLLALITQFVYVHWRKRRFRRRSVVCGSNVSVDSEFSNSPFYPAPSKELLYFFCWKNQPTRVEPSSGVVSPTPTAAPTAPDYEAGDVEADDDELAKWQAVHGPSRALYTIKEEEREEADSVQGSVYDQSEAKSEKRICLRDCVSGGVEMADDARPVDVEEATPFSTPCASPPYFTPSPSPGRDVGISISSPENDDVSLPDSDVLTDTEVGFVSLRIEG